MTLLVSHPIEEISARIRFDAARGALTDGDIRYVLIRADGLMRAFAGPAAPASLSALGDSVYRHGRQSLLKYRSEIGPDPAPLLAAVRSISAVLGWGTWTFARSGAHELRLTVQNSPFAAGMGVCDVAACAPILGMLRAAAELVLGEAVLAREDACVACGADCCAFSARLATAV